MFKCGPYIKSICNSINTWREAGGSLPASPIRQSWLTTPGNQVPPSPTRSEGQPTSTSRETRLSPLVVSEEPMAGDSSRSNMPTLVATTTVDENGVASTEVTMSLAVPTDEHNFQQPPHFRSESDLSSIKDNNKRRQIVSSPEVTRRRLRNLGAIPKKAPMGCGPPAGTTNNLLLLSPALSSPTSRSERESFLLPRTLVKPTSIQPSVRP